MKFEPTLATLAALLFGCNAPCSLETPSNCGCAPEAPHAQFGFNISDGCVGGIEFLSCTDNNVSDLETVCYVRDSDGERFAALAYMGQGFTLCDGEFQYELQSFLPQCKDGMP